MTPSNPNGEWCKTTFFDPYQEDRIICELPILWRFEPSMGRVTLAAPNVFAQAAPGSVSLLAGSVEAARGDDGKQRSGIYIARPGLDDEVCHIPVLAKGNSDYVCIVTEPIPIEQWPVGLDLIGVDLHDFNMECIRVQAIGTTPVPTLSGGGVVGHLKDMSLSLSNDSRNERKPKDSGRNRKKSGSTDLDVRERYKTPRLKVKASEEIRKKAPSTKGSLKRGTLRHWHSVLNHKPKLRIVQTLKSGYGGGLTTQLDGYLCTSCVQGKARNLPRSGNAGGGATQATALEAFLAPGVAYGLNAEEIASVRVAALEKLKKITEKGSGSGRKRLLEDSTGNLVQHARLGITQPMERLFLDLLGPMETKNGGKCYVCLVVCKLTKFMWQFVCRTKACVIGVIQKLVLIARTAQYAIKQITTDAGAEHTSVAWRDTCMAQGIKPVSLMPRSQYGNLVERMIQEVKEDLRTTLIHAMLPIRIYSVILIQGIIDIHNRLACESLDWDSPYLLFYGVAPDLSRLQILGSTVWIVKPHSHLPGGSQYAGPLAAQAVEAILVGYTDQGYYRCRRLDTGRLLDTREAIFEDLVSPRHRAPLQHRINSQVGIIPEASDVYTSLEASFDGKIMDDDSPIGSIGIDGSWEIFTKANRMTPQEFLNYDPDPSDTEEYRDVPVIRELQERSLFNWPLDEQTKVTREINMEFSDPSARNQGQGQRLNVSAYEGKAEHPPMTMEQSAMEPSEPEVSGMTQHSSPSTRKSTRSNKGNRKIINVSQEYAAKPNTPVLSVGGTVRINALQTKPDDSPSWFLVQEGEITNGEFFTPEETEDCDVLLDFAPDNTIKAVVVRQNGGRMVTPETLVVPRDSGLHKNNPDYTLEENLAAINQGEALDREHINAVKTKSMNYGEAIAKNKDPHDKQMFIDSTRVEWITNLVGKGAVQYVEWAEVPTDTKVIPLLATYCRKQDPTTGLTNKWKCRICLRGDIMDPEIHCKEGSNYAPTADLTAARMVIGIGNRPGMWRGKLDVSSAYTQCNPGALVYASTTAGCHKFDSTGRKQVVKICKNLYGSPDAAAIWLNQAVELLLRIGFRRSLQDPCLFRLSFSRSKAREEMKSWKADKDQDKRKLVIKEEYPRRVTLIEDYGSRIGNPAGYEELKTAMGTMEQDHDFPCGMDEAKDVHHYDLNDLICYQPDNHEPDHIFCLINLWVDDGLITSNDPEWGRYIIERILHRYPGTSEEDPSHFLGIVMETVKGKTKLTQDVLLSTLLSDCKMGSSNRSNDVPMTTLVEVDKTVHSEEYKTAIKDEVDFFRFAGIIGWLRHTMPCLSFAHAQFTRIMSNPNAIHVKQAKYLCRWLQGQRRQGITYDPLEDKGLFVYSDTGLDVDVYTGTVVHFGGAVVFAKAGRQRFQSQNTMESEMSGLNESARVAIYLQSIMLDLGEKVGTITVFGDNQSAIHEFMEGAPECCSKKARHHRLRYAWTKQLVQMKRIKFVWISTKDMLADVCTKPLPKDIWNELYPQMMGTSPIKSLADYPTVTERYGPMTSTKGSESKED